MYIRTLLCSKITNTNKKTKKNGE